MENKQFKKITSWANTEDKNVLFGENWVKEQFGQYLDYCKTNGKYLSTIRFTTICINKALKRL